MIPLFSVWGFESIVIHTFLFSSCFYYIYYIYELVVLFYMSHVLGLNLLSGRFSPGTPLLYFGQYVGDVFRPLQSFS